jgi:hypothetical protein
MISVFRDHARTLAKVLLGGALSGVAAYIAWQLIAGAAISSSAIVIAAGAGALLPIAALFLIANIFFAEEDGD